MFLGILYYGYNAISKRRSTSSLVAVLMVWANFNFLSMWMLANGAISVDGRGLENSGFYGQFSVLMFMTDFWYTIFGIIFMVYFYRFPIVPATPAAKPVEQEMVLEPVAMHPPAAATEESTQEFRFTEDVPGVKPSQLYIKASNDTLIVKGKRTMGDNTICMRRLVEIPRGTDMTQAKAYLVDGVLTVVAPKAQELQPTSLRTIYVNDMPLVEALQIQVEDNKDDDKKEEDEIMVETVAEEKEWEHVDEDSKPPAKN